MKKIAVISVCDYDTKPMGGEVSLLRNLLVKFRSERVSIHLIGVSFDRDEHVGIWNVKVIGNNEYPWLPVAYINQQKRSFIPNRIRLRVGLDKCRDAIADCDFDGYYIHSPEAFDFCAADKKPVVYHVHGNPHFTLRMSRFRLFRMKPFVVIYDDITKRALLGSSKVIWAATRSMNDYRASNPDVVEKIQNRVEIIHSSVDPIFEKYADACGDKEQNNIIVTVSRLAQIKHVDFLIDVFNALWQRNNELNFLICGDGEESAKLKAKALQLPSASAIHFLGNLPKKELAATLAKSSLFMFASESEAMSLVVLESLYMGVPVLSTDVGDISIAVRNETGSVVGSRDIDEFTFEALKILSSHTGRPQACRSEGIKYSTEIMASKVEDALYRACE